MCARARVRVSAPFLSCTSPLHIRTSSHPLLRFLACRLTFLSLLVPLAVSAFQEAKPDMLYFPISLDVSGLDYFPPPLALLVSFRASRPPSGYRLVADAHSSAVAKYYFSTPLPRTSQLLCLVALSLGLLRRWIPQPSPLNW